MIRRLIKIAVIMGALLLGGNVIAGEDLSNGEAKYNEVCATCHGNYGEISDDVIPNILGQYPAYLLTQMAAFLSDDPKESRRGVAGNLKRSILSGLSVQDIQDIVAYLGTINYEIVGASKKEAESRGELAANGWWLANFAGCGNCHGDDFQGLRVRNPGTGELDPGVGAPMTPKLVGLKYDYLVRQLSAYQSGDRAGGMSAMKHIMAPLFQSPRMMQAIGVYAEEVSIVPLPASDSEVQQ
jgi:cytochrome c553